MNEQLTAISNNPYPGRGIVIGRDETGKCVVQIYWIMGRSENSRNRILSCGGNLEVFTEAADPKKVKDPSLIIYNAMLKTEFGEYVVSNGHQTDALAKRNCTPFRALEPFQYEPDAPNFTPRISGICCADGSAWFSSLKKSPTDDSCERAEYIYANSRPGIGRCITTYSGDGDPLPSFRDEPFMVPLEGNSYQIMTDYWSALNKENRISLAVRFIKLDTGMVTTLIENKYKKVS